MSGRRGPRRSFKCDPLVPHFVYTHRNAAGEVIYVGCTRDLAARTQAHRTGAHWWPEVAEVVVEDVRPDRPDGLHLEGCLIVRYLPKYNIRGKYAHDNPDHLYQWERLAAIDEDIAEHILPVVRERVAAKLAGAA